MFKQCDISSVISSTEESSEFSCDCCHKKKPQLKQKFIANEDTDNIKLALQKEKEYDSIQQMQDSLDNIIILIKMITKQQYDDYYFRHQDYTNLKAQERYKKNYQLFLDARDLIFKCESDISKLMNPLEQQQNLKQQYKEIDFEYDQEDKTENITYEQKHVINCFEQVQTAVLSEDLTLLASCYKKNCQIWNYEINYEVLEYENDNLITALCLQQQDKLIIGDKIGYIIIITFNQYQQLNVWEYKLHDQDVYYLIQKDDCQFYSYSRNNRLILFDQKLEIIVFQIDVSIMGFGNFDYCPKNKFLIAPSSLGLTIWNGQNGQEIITSSQLYKADNVIQVCYESQTSQILLSLQKKKRILVLSYDTESIKFLVKKIFCLYGIVTNVSWLNNGKYFVIFYDDHFQVRSTKCHKLPLRYHDNSKSKMTFLNKQHNSGKYLISIEENYIYLYERNSAK